MSPALLLGLLALGTPQERALLHKAEMRPFPTWGHPSDTLHAYDILHYRLEIQVFPSTQSIEAHETVHLVSESDTLSRVVLHLDGLTVDSVRVDDIPTTFARQDTNLIIALGGPAPAGDTLTLDLYYHGVPTHGGGVFGGGLTITPYVIYADNEPYGAKRWLACWDWPTEKATWEVIATVPAGFRVVANGVLVDSILGNDWWTYHWRENYPIATYLIVFAARNFAVIRDTLQYSGYTMPVTHYVRHADSALAASEFANTVDMLTFFSDTFGLYPFIEEKYAHVQVPIGGAMENQTNTFYGFPIHGGRGHDWVIAHELGHQWWGDWVTLGDWRDIWLNEGFATYCEALYIGHRDGGNAYHDYMVNNIMQYYLNTEPYPPYPIYDPVFMWGSTVYEKGASVLHMLRHVVGDSVFFEILREYGRRFAYGNAVTTDFVAVCEEVSGQDLDWFFDEWVFAPGHPEYEYLWGFFPGPADSYTVYLQIQQVQGHNFGIPTYKMPIDIRIQTVAGETTVVVWDSLDLQSFTIRVPAQPLNLLFDPDDWILKEATGTAVAELPEPDRPVRMVLTPVSVNPGAVLLHLREQRALGLWVYDAQGRRAQAIFSGVLPAGIHRFDFPTLPSGVYLLLLEAGNGVSQARKVLVVR